MTLAIVAILVVTTAILGATVVIATRSSMLRQVDQRLVMISRRPPILPGQGVTPPGAPGEQPIPGAPPGAPIPPGQGEPIGGGPPQDFADGSGFRPEAVITVDTSGAVVASQPAGFFDDPLPLPDLPANPAIALARPTSISGGGVAYRAIASRVPSGVTVFAVPLNDVQATASRSLFVVLAMGTLVVIAGGVIAWAVVGRQLRPVGVMIDTAAEIAAGDLSRRVVTPKDGSELARLAAALNTMLAHVQRSFAEREASQERLKRFVGDAAHELRTPLTSIRGYAELYRTGALQDGPELDRALGRVEGEATRMQAIIDDMVLLARLDQSQPLIREPVDLSALAADGLDDLRAAEPQRPLSIVVPAPAIVLGDEDRLRQVIANLLSNARSHTPPDAAVAISVQVVASSAVLKVRDEGPGMAPDVRAMVFDRFFRGDPSRSRDTGGAGLGLSIVDAIVTAHGGAVAIDSALGEGTTFTVTIPLAP